MVTLLYLENVTVKICDALTIASDSDLKAQVDAGGNVVEVFVKSVRIEGGERDADVQKFSNYTEELEQKRSGPVTATLELALDGGDASNIDTAEMFMGTKQAVGTTAYLRAQGGEKSANDRTAKCLLVNDLVSSGVYANSALNNAIVTTRPFEFPQAGHAPVTLTFKCKASDYWEEDNVA